MTDHAERLNTLLGEVFDEYDKSNGPISREDVLVALAWTMAGILSSIDPLQLRRKHIKIYQRRSKSRTVTKTTMAQGCCNEREGAF